MLFLSQVFFFCSALHTKNGSLAKKKIEAIVVLSFIAMLLMVAAVCCLIKRKRLMGNQLSFYSLLLLSTLALVYHAYNCSQTLASVKVLGHRADKQLRGRLTNILLMWPKAVKDC